ncbi:hypothetical protein KVR01_012052 [Diaporthe batatas]|uniref:uncharacterized protein n=1 Tax=Diaporthe batatas TaxID=748121 RepID=UPI001D04C882|nr:uncharacterized protein KVR01_012052 [Diaporthe batatas]KAG8158291.1 hypothetical protein KVR01_012052 [Diaporthe batatas]
MDVFQNMSAAPLEPAKVPYKSTTIRIPKNDGLLARKPRDSLLCTVCDRPGHLKCSGCHSMRYCSVQCQKLDRNTHKFFCKSFARFTDDKRPSPHHVRAIVFPEHKTQPEWTWVLRNDDRTALCLSHMYERLDTDGLTEQMPVMYMSCTVKRVAPHWLFSLILSQSNERKWTSMINQSVLNLGPPGHLMLYWGPMLVVGGTPQMAPPDQHHEHPMINRLEDVTLDDTPFVIEAVLYGDHDSPCVVDVPRYSRYWKSLPGLKVNCLGDCLRFHSEKDSFNIPKWEATAVHERVTVPNKMELNLWRQFPCILPFLLGLPWLCRRAVNCFPEPQETPIDWKFAVSKLSNSHLGRVHACLYQHGSESCGYPRPEVDPKMPANIEELNPPGTRILVHLYGEPILMGHLKVFNLFVKQAKLDDWWKPGFGYKTFNRELFRQFWADRKRANDVQYVDLTDVPCPYAWMDKPRQEDRYVEGFAQFERLLQDAVTDVYFDNVFRGGRPNPWAGGTGDWSEYFDPLN